MKTITRIQGNDLSDATKVSGFPSRFLPLGTPATHCGFRSVAPGRSPQRPPIQKLGLELLVSFVNHRPPVANPIPALNIEAQIKRELRTHLKALGFTKTIDGDLQIPDSSKDTFRQLHRLQRIDRLQSSGGFVAKQLPRLLSHFANGSEIQVRSISPTLESVESGKDSAALFRLAALTWSIPVSSGYGRRMRFLVRDSSNGKLIGIIGLTDPVFNLKVRDQWIGWNSKERKANLVRIMDAFVLGAVPPYSFLLGGKLIASILRTTDIRDAFHSKYFTTKGIISRRRKHPDLVAITTTSALGRSSVYNRLTLANVRYLNSLGYTSGWGHFHLPDPLFEKMRLYLSQRNSDYCSNNRFGDGPNWKLRAIRKCLILLGLAPALLRHGINREVYFCELADNVKDALKFGTEPNYSDLLSVSEVGRLAVERWLAPRADRDSSFKAWKNESLCQLLIAATEPFTQRAIQINR